jgi:hypothetical protein
VQITTLDQSCPSVLPPSHHALGCFVEAKIFVACINQYFYDPFSLKLVSWGLVFLQNFLHFEFSNSNLLIFAKLTKPESASLQR